jgi:hypothetical protein
VALSQAIGKTVDESIAEPYLLNMLALRATARQRHIAFFTALTPPRNESPDPAVLLTSEINHHLRSDLDPASIVDFFSSMVVPDDFLDEQHLAPSGQTKRAEEAHVALEP